MMLIFAPYSLIVLQNGTKSSSFVNKNKRSRRVTVASLNTLQHIIDRFLISSQEFFLGVLVSKYIAIEFSQVELAMIHLFPATRLLVAKVSGGNTPDFAWRAGR
jgi:hypothetical protein